MSNNAHGSQTPIEQLELNGKCYPFSVERLEKTDTLVARYYDVAGGALRLSYEDYIVLTGQAERYFDTSALLGVVYATELVVDKVNYTFEIEYDPTKDGLAATATDIEDSSQGLVVTPTTRDTIWDELFWLYDVMWLANIFAKVSVTLASSRKLDLVLVWSDEYEDYVAVPTEGEHRLTESEHTYLRQVLRARHGVARQRNITCQAHRESVTAVLEMVKVVTPPTNPLAAVRRLTAIK